MHVQTSWIPYLILRGPPIFLLLLTFTSVVLFPVVHAQAPTLTTLLLGSLLPFSSPNDNLRLPANDVWKGMQLALQDLTPELSQQGYQLKFRNIDYLQFSNSSSTLSMKSGILNASLQLSRTSIHGIMSPLLPHFFPGVIDVINLHKLPMCNHASSIPDLFTSKLYPYTFNIAPSLSHYASGFLQLLKKFGWSHFLVLFSTDIFGVSLSNILKSETVSQPWLDAKLIGFDEKANSSTMIDSSLSLAFKTKYRVYFVSAIGEPRKELLRFLMERKVFLKHNITWVFVEDVKDTLNGLPNGFGDFSIAESLVGTFSIRVKNTLTQLSTFNTFKERVVSPTSSSQLNPNVALDAYVCTVALVRGLISKTTSSSLPSLSWDKQRMMTDSAVKVPVIGEGGVPVQFDTEGNLPVHISITNWQMRGTQVIGVLNTTGPWKMSSGPFVFLGGTSIPPSDLEDLDDLYIYVHSVSGLSVIIITGILAVFCLISVGLLLMCSSHPELAPSLPWYTLWMMVGSLFFLSCIVTQFFIPWDYGCNLSLLLGTLGAGNTLGPLIAKTIMAIQSEHPFLNDSASATKTISSIASASSSPSSPSSATSFTTPKTSRKWMTRPTQISLSVVLIDIFLALLYVLITPLQGTRVNIGTHSQTYLCVTPHHSVSTNPLFFILVLYHAFLVFWIMLMSWQSPSKAMKSSAVIRLISILTYQYSLVGLLIFLTWALDSFLYPISFWIKIASLFLTVTLHYFLIVLPPLFSLYKHLRPSLHPRASMFKLPSSSLELPWTSTPILSSSSVHDYEGTLMYATWPSPLSSSSSSKTSTSFWSSFFRSQWWRPWTWWSSMEFTWHRVSLRVLPESQWFFLIDAKLGFKYQHVIYSPHLAHSRISRIFPQARRSHLGSPSVSSKHMFYVFTKKKVFLFWAHREDVVKTWVDVFKRGIGSTKPMGT
ncbi:hypothetical protein HMI54_010961 [Coelomomyces lativittatus]|nr:hypothetical protein HMI56_006432 [Coelomomyces lativittatus]KAJ1513825.1 hypothetical protein HMI55_005196 [Coelomomyces lativittatus]KAJ1518705.1 hypothetical protein HMI54_010961 [Coelomomyces lativittatus]